MGPLISVSQLSNMADLSHCGKITDVGISALAHGCHLLNNIDLSSCSKITGGGISAVAQGCSNLRNVSQVY